MHSSSRSFRLMSLAALIGVLTVSVTITAVAAPAAKTAAHDTVVTGQHRGYTNDELYLRLDNEREMTFLVRIPGDKDAKWHDQFATLSRITVTYHSEPGEKRPIATAIKAAK